ncbi:hypothetical protein [Aestuariimicrobium ganziense]|uniref:hypothetical protein n=1 Tax=Aestuariimicrobium ganziense TaxID=2773677 RepID=UPI0019441CAA|nr:hypothetical protein [Aestuariimicrobium ganziense]
MNRRILALVLMVTVLALVALALVKPWEGSDSSRARTADSTTLKTWWFDDHEQNAEGPVADEAVRRSSFYEVRVASAAAPEQLFDSFVHMSIPRSGRDKQGYADEDGAEFASEARMTMCWSSFLQDEDVWVEVSLTTGQTIGSADEVTVRPLALDLTVEMVDQDTVRVPVPRTAQGSARRPRPASSLGRRSRRCDADRRSGRPRSE